MLCKKIYLFELFKLFKGPGRAHTGPYGPEKSKKVREKFAFSGAFKGPAPCLKLQSAFNMALSSGPMLVGT